MDISYFSVILSKQFEIKEKTMSIFDSHDYCTCKSSKNIHTEFSDQGSLSICDHYHKLIKDSFKSFETYTKESFVGDFYN